MMVLDGGKSVVSAVRADSVVCFGEVDLSGSIHVCVSDDEVPVVWPGWVAKVVVGVGDAAVSFVASGAWRSGARC